MAMKTSVEFVDDLDGRLADETVRFGLDGVIYEIDLCSANAENLRAHLESWVAAARRVGGRITRLSPQTAMTHEANTAAIRTWARKNGYSVGDRGRIPVEVIAAYQRNAVPENEIVRPVAS